MKRAIVILLAMALLGTCVSVLPALARPFKVAHEDPTTAGVTRPARGLLAVYNDVIDLAEGSQYEAARERLNDLDEVSVPADMEYLVGQYGDLYRRFFEKLAYLEGQLEETSSLIARHRADEARARLEAAGSAAAEADVLVRETQAATAGLDERVGALSGLLPGDPVARACDDLQDNIGRLADIVDEMETLKDDLTAQYAALEGLIPVVITLEVAPSSAFVGEEVTARGRLMTGGDRPLPARRVTIANDNLTADAVTGNDGYYEVQLSLPYVYTENISLTAEFNPAGDDMASFLGDRSAPAFVATIYHATRIDVSLPGAVFPGLPFTLAGMVTPGEDSAGREVIVALDGQPLAKAAVPASGRFSLEVTPPPGTPPGQRELVLTVPPRGRYAGASAAQQVMVSIMNMQVHADIPSLVLVPGDVIIRGVAYNGAGPAGGMTINLSMGPWRATAVSTPDGHFLAELPLRALPPAAPQAGNPLKISPVSLEIPFNPWPIGWQDLDIMAGAPGFPAGAFETRRRIISINPLTTGLLAALIAAACVMVCLRRREAPAPAFAGRPEETPETPPAIVPLPPVPALTGLRARVLAAYRRGLAAVENLTGLAMGPGTTMREFLGTVPLPSNSSRERFIELTGLAESSLYSRGDPRRETAARAEALASSIKEDLAGGAA